MPSAQSQRRHDLTTHEIFLIAGALTQEGNRFLALAKEERFPIQTRDVMADAAREHFALSQKLLRELTNKPSEAA